MAKKDLKASIGELAKALKKAPQSDGWFTANEIKDQCPDRSRWAVDKLITDGCLNGMIEHSKQARSNRSGDFRKIAVYRFKK